MTLETLAYHEAGHAVAAELLGVRVESVWINDRRGCCDLVAVPENGEIKCVINVAGTVTEALHNFLPAQPDVRHLLSDPDGAPMDLPDWFRLASPGAESFWDCAVRLLADLIEAANLLESRSEAVCAIVRELRQVGQTDGARVRMILERRFTRDWPPVKPRTAIARAAEYLKPVLHELWEGRDQARSTVTKPVRTYERSPYDRMEYRTSDAIPGIVKVR